MGVPKFYRWLSERYPLINQLLSTAAVLPDFDNFYLDMNGIIHACTHPNSDFLANSLSMREMMLSIFRYVDRMVTEIVKPKRLLFMAIDGVAPRAKLNQQRARRFCAAEGRTDAINQAKARGEAVDEEALFDSNCITPGTEFMDLVSRHLKYFIRKKIKEDPLWRNLTIVFSGHDVPGEGEHKIMQFIRDLRADPNYEPNLRHCMYGQDADLIMLGLATHEPHFALLREVIHFNVGGPKKPAREVVMRQTKEAQFQLLHLSILREYLMLDFAHGIDTPVDQERIIDDFIFLTFLVGNDFLPHLPTLDISEHAFDMLINGYRQLFLESPGYIVHRGEIGDYKRLEGLFQIVGSQEHDILANRAEEVKSFNDRRRKHQSDVPTEEELEEAEEAMQSAFEAALKEAMGGSTENTAAGSDSANAPMDDMEGEGEEGEGDEEGDEGEELEPKKDYRGRYYYEKFKVIASAPDGELFLTHLMEQYLKGLIWCLAYYVKGCISWTWYYPFHYGPMLQDMKNLEELQTDISYELGQPFTPYQQLLGCLPPASARLLPSCYRWLMTNSDSPVIGFYPLTFKVDQDGKKNPWEAVVLLDFIDECKLLAGEDVHCPSSKLTRAEIARNSFGSIQVYTFDPAVTDTYLSCNPEIGLPDIHRCASSLVEVTYSLAPGHYFKAELVPGTVYPIAGYPSLTVLPLEKITLEALKVNVFGSASRYKTMALGIHSQKIENFESSKAEMLLNRVVYVNYPQVHEAKVIGISTESWEVKLEGDLDDPNYQPKAIKITYDHYATQKWKTEATAEVTKYLTGRNTPGSGGLIINDIDIRLKVRPLQGLKRDAATGASRKVYAKSLEADVPIQLALWTPPVQDTRFQETSEMPVEKLMPYGASVVALVGSLIGCKGTVVGPHTPETKFKNPVKNPLKKKLVDVEFKIPQPEPPFGYSIAQSINDQYYGARDICNLLKISPNVLGKVVGSIRVEPGRGDLGLNLKRNGVYQMLGYVRRADPSNDSNTVHARKVWQGVDTVHIVGVNTEPTEAEKSEAVYWEYSSHAASLIAEYKARFPVLFQQLERLPHQPVYTAQDLLGEKAAAQMAAIMEWMKAQSFFSMPRTPFTTLSLSKEAMAAIERASDVHTTLNATKGMVTKLVKGIPIEKVYCNVHRTSHDTALTYNSLEPKLGDRVVNLACSGVPFGLKGTVVTIHQATQYVEVIFDEEFISGKSLQGNCSQFRGRLCLWSDLLLVSAKSELRGDERHEEIGTVVETVAASPAVPAVPSAPVEVDNKSQKLLSILKAPAKAAEPAPVAPTPAAPAASKGAALLSFIKPKAESVVETKTIAPTSQEQDVAPAAVATAVKSNLNLTDVLNSKRKKLMQALSAINDDEEDVDPKIDVLIENTQAISLDGKVSNGTGRSILAAAAGVEDPEKTTDLLAPPEQNVLAHFPWMGVISYAAGQQAPPPEPTAAPVVPPKPVHEARNVSPRRQARPNTATPSNTATAEPKNAVNKGRASINKEASHRVVKHELGISGKSATDKAPASNNTKNNSNKPAHQGNKSENKNGKKESDAAPAEATTATTPSPAAGALLKILKKPAAAPQEVDQTVEAPATTEAPAAASTKNDAPKTDQLKSLLGKAKAHMKAKAQSTESKPEAEVKTENTEA